MNDLDKRLEEIAGEAAKRLIDMEDANIPQEPYTPIILEAIHQAIREAVLASGAAEALGAGLTFAVVWKAHYGRKYNDGVDHPDHEKATVDINAALANLKRLTQP